MKGGKEKGGIPAGSLAALAQTAAGAPWPGVILMSAGAAMLQKLTIEQSPPRWLQTVQSLWSAFLLSQVLTWAGESWPGGENRIWVGLIVLLLVWWLTRKGREAAAAASGVLGILELGLLAAVLLGSVREIKPENLLPARGLPDGWLLAVLLLPGIGQKRNGLWALPFSLVTAGVGVCGANAFWQMSRCASGFGSVRRLESLAATGLTIGLYLTAGELLSRQNNTDRLWSAALTAGLFLSGFHLNGWIAAAGAALVWWILPLIFRRKATI